MSEPMTPRRAEPAIVTDIVFPEGSTVTVKAGPTDAQGYAWDRLQDGRWVAGSCFALVAKATSASPVPATTSKVPTTGVLPHPLPPRPTAD